MRSKLTLCPNCQRPCDTCGGILRVLAYCPPCAGRKGGSSRSAKKQESSRKNILRTRLMRKKSRRERRERGQVFHV
jgi:hypothetical protein